MNQLEKINYKGWPNCYRLCNGRVELVVTTDVGPRLIHFGFVDDANHFAVLAETAGQTGGDEWRVYGGHRLWHAPESVARTYAPDNQPVQIETAPDGVRLVQPVEAATGMQKEMVVRLAPDAPQVQVTHRLTNRGVWPVACAPWALSVMAGGGTAVIPLPPRQSHEEALLPTSAIALWAYTDMTDARWHWGREFVLLKQDPGVASPQKAGFQVIDGWVAYANHGQLFVKTFAQTPNSPYPDLNSNVELFVNGRILEVETLGVLGMVAPETAVTHTETWHLFPDVPQPDSEQAVIDHILPRINPLMGGDKSTENLT